MKNKILLLGYMGSGKSVVAQKLAAELVVNHIDLDAYIEQQEATSIAKLFAEKGEIYFRKKEFEVLSKLLDNQESLVISLGGGTPCFQGVLPLILNNKNTTVIFLEASIDTLVGRLFDEKEKRPLLSHISKKEDLSDFIKKHLFERNFYYHQAHHKIKVDNKSVRQIVIEIKQKLL